MTTEKLESLRIAGDEEIGLCTDNDYFAIQDSSGVIWSTETLSTGEQVRTVLRL